MPAWRPTLVHACRSRTWTGKSSAATAAFGLSARAFVGSAKTVSEKIVRLAEAFELDEVVVNTWAHDPAVRRTSYALLAEAFSLSAAASGT